MAASSTATAGCSNSMSDETAAGKRGSDEDRSAGRGVGERPCYVRRAGRHVAQHEEEDGIGDGCSDAVQDPGYGMVTVGTATHDPGGEHNADGHDRESRQEAPGGPLGEDRPGGYGHEEHLEVAEHRRHPGTDVGDGVVPQDEVDGEGDSGGGCLATLRRAARAVATLFEQGDHAECGQCEQAAEECRRRGPDIGELHEDGR